MMPVTVNLPTDYRGAYMPATVVAAIPMGTPHKYVVVIVNPGGQPGRRSYAAAETSRAHDQFDAPWFADETTEPGPLADALGDMATLAGVRLRPRML